MDWHDEGCAVPDANFDSGHETRDLCDQRWLGKPGGLTVRQIATCTINCCAQIADLGVTDTSTCFCCAVLLYVDVYTAYATPAVLKSLL